MTISKELLDELLKGYEDGQDAPPNQPNRRNGTASKRLKGQDGELPIPVPRDRGGSFEPELITKSQTRIDGMDDKIIHCPAGDLRGKSAERGLYAAGLTVRDIRAHLENVYGLQVSPDLPLGYCCAIPCRAADQPRHRRRAERSPRVAVPSAGPNVSHRHLRRASGEDP